MVGSSRLKRPDVAIRCDGSKEIGMGHVVRMLAFARALTRYGLRPIFVLRSGQPKALEMLTEAEFEVHEVASGDSSGSRLGRSDARQLTEFSHGAPVIVDHYGAGSEYFAYLAEAGVRYGVIDDLADRDLRGAEWILNPVPGFEAAYEIGGAERLLIGPQYALLRPEFAYRRSSLRRRSLQARRVLLTLGGGGDSGEVAHLRSALGVIDGIEIECATGGRSAAEMAELMAWADIAVSAAGQTAWEFACMGVPSVLVCVAENQRANAAALSRVGCALIAGMWNESSSADVVCGHVRSLIEDSATRTRMSAAGMNLVDGLGADRAAIEISALWRAER